MNETTNHSCKRRRGSEIHTFHGSGQPVTVETFKSINQAKRANRGNLEPCMPVRKPQVHKLSSK